MSVWDTMKDLGISLSWGLSFGFGLILGIITVTAKATKYETRFVANEKAVADIQKILFQERGGLNVLTEAEHDAICQTNIEILDLKLKPLQEDMAIVKDILQKMQERRR